MKTAPHLDDELGEALQAYAERIPAVPDNARLLAALDAAPRAAAFRAPRSRMLTAGAAAGLVALLGGGALVWSLGGPDASEERIVKVTEVPPVTTEAPTTLAPVTTPATTTPATTVPPTTLPPTTVAPTPVQAAPPAAPVTAAAVVQQPPASAAPKRSQKTSAPTTAAHRADPPAHVPPAQPPASVAWSASAAFGTCADDPPYDVYAGTADPGTTVSITSPYGGGSATADEQGYWEREVVFEGAPLNETFTVTVSSAQGTDTFDFTHTG